MFLLNSRLGHFPATRSPTAFRRQLLGHPFSRSYGVSLPSSLTRVPPLACGFSPRLPVSVCSTGTFGLARGFSRQCGFSRFGTYLPSPSPFSTTRRICLPGLPSGLDAPYQPRARPTLLRHPFAPSASGGTGLSTRYPSPTHSHASA